MCKGQGNIFGEEIFYSRHLDFEISKLCRNCNSTDVKSTIIITTNNKFALQEEESSFFISEKSMSVNYQVFTRNSGQTEKFQSKQGVYY
jgi:hypothetical protein